MRAVLLTEQGGTENLVMKEVDRPNPKAGEVLVEVHAISINPVDVKTRKGGGLLANMKKDGDVILGWDISGVVVDAGSDVKQFKKGDAVFGMVNFPGHGKAYAEYVVAPVDHLAIKPDNITHAEAAATTLAALTAWQVLKYEANLQKGQRLLMHAAAGGVGHFAVQLAKLFGAKVTGTASAANAGFLKDLGIDQVIDYTNQRFEDQVQDVDVVFDPIGGETTQRSIGVLKEGGTLISIVGGVKDPLQPLIQEKKIKAKNFLVHSSGSDMEQLAALLKNQELKPYLSHEYSFDQIAQAHQQIETGKTRGKVIVQIR